ncbi:phage tail length tape measure family protein [Arsukibacterium sp.]|uniref:phage tail length tape measure family protein n=1 Tax=Arsukibacterium sp. TaxID=1977258 RepID=UPI00299ECBF4|nr:phage tail length tape measure family protein [Arsukibacterium sp.]MDX1538824.1 phage tail length tape measure family protein [Arsukibacterium sp.]
MSKDIIANLVAKMELDGAQFQKEMARVNKSTNGYQKNIKAANDSQGRFRKEFSRFTEGIGRAPGPLGSLTNGLGSLTSGLGVAGGAAIAAGAAVAALGAIYAKGVAVAARFEQSQFRIEAQLRANNSAAGLTSREITDLADSVARNTLASVDGVRQAAGILMQFKSVQGETFKEAIMLAQDISAIYGNGLPENIKKLGKVLSDPANAIGELKEVTDRFDESLKSTIRTMVESGDVAGAQRLILKELRGVVGGSGAGEGQGLAGAADGLGQSWEALLNNIGNTKPVIAATSALDGLLQRVNKEIAPFDMPVDEMPARLKELQAEYDATAAAQKKYLNGRDPKTLSRRPAQKNSGFQSELNEISAEQKALTKIYNEEMLQRELAAEQAERQRLKTESEAAALKAQTAKKAADEKLKRDIASSKNTLFQLDSQYASEEEKLQLASDKRLQQISTLIASEADLRRMGFDSVEQMRADYQAKELSSLDAQIAELKARKDKERADNEDRAQAEIDKEIEHQNNVIEFRRGQMDYVADQYKTEQQLMQEYYEDQEQIVRDYYSNVGGITEEGEALIADIKKRAKLDQLNFNIQNTQMMLSSGQELFGSLAEMAKNHKGEQSKTYKAMFAASKAFAIAQSTVSIFQGIANAAAVPWPLNLAAIASTISATAGLISNITGTQLSGARANGGPVGPNGWYLVGERGPELLRTGSGTGKVTSNENLRAALQSGGQSGQQANFNFNFTGMDNDSLLEMLMENRGAIAGMVSSAFEDQGIRLAG